LSVKNLCASCLLLLLLPLSIFAEPLLWQVNSASSQKNSPPVYLFGSIHYGRDSFYPLPSRIQRAFESSEILAVEIDSENLNPHQAAAAVRRHGLYSTGESLRSALSKKDWNLLEKICRQLNVEPLQMNGVKPWLVAVQLLDLEIRTTAYSQDKGVDQHMLRQGHGHRLVELETMEQQLSIFSQLTEGEQVQFLRQTLESFDGSAKTLTSLAQAWLKGDEALLAEFILGAFEDDETSQKLYQLIFVDRNRQMSTAVEQFLFDKQAVFMVVGLGHLLGKDGVVAELRRRGYIVRQLRSDGS